MFICRSGVHAFHAVIECHTYQFGHLCGDSLHKVHHRLCNANEPAITEKSLITIQTRLKLLLLNGLHCIELRLDDVSKGLGKNDRLEKGIYSGNDEKLKTKGQGKYCDLSIRMKAVPKEERWIKQHAFIVSSCSGCWDCGSLMSSDS